MKFMAAALLDVCRLTSAFPLDAAAVNHSLARIGSKRAVISGGGWSLSSRWSSSPEQLRALYEEAGVRPDRETIAYCRIGERSSHTWYVLKYLLGYEKVRNYDGSWTEWGNLVGAPIEK